MCSDFDSQRSADRITALCERLRIAQIIEIGDELDRAASARVFAFRTGLAPDVVRDILLTTPTNADVLRNAARLSGSARLKVVA